MNNGFKNLDEIKNHWIKSSDKNFITMLNLFDSKDYDWSLFMGHLIIEKLLKANFIQINQQFPPRIHNLLRLAELCKIKLNTQDVEFFSTVTTFNIETRYDDYKESFYRKCTKEFSENWISKIKEKREWIKMQLK